MAYWKVSKPDPKNYTNPITHPHIGQVCPPHALPCEKHVISGGQEVWLSLNFIYFKMNTVLQRIN